MELRALALDPETPFVAKSVEKKMFFSTSRGRRDHYFKELEGIAHIFEKNVSMDAMMDAAAYGALISE